MIALPDLDPRSGRAVFRQIADGLRDAITSGQLGSGARLPSEAELVERYGTARATVRQALAILATEGLVVAEHGRGVFVRVRPALRRLAADRFSRKHREAGLSAFIAEVTASGHESSVDRLSVTTAPASESVAERLELPAGAQVVVRSRRYLVDGRPVQSAVSYLPADIAGGTAIAEPDPGPGGIYARLEELGHQLERLSESLVARMPVPDEVADLELPPGVPVVGLVRIAYATNGRPVELCETVLAGDSFVLEYELPAR
ncbi:MAG: GntR family transcriptional regulator [Sporichthyaceae bacterium]|nr:GntR family transcriptional regulator [Sporichthyaceae bacterium]